MSSWCSELESEGVDYENAMKTKRTLDAKGNRWWGNSIAMAEKGYGPSLSNELFYNSTCCMWCRVIFHDATSIRIRTLLTRFSWKSRSLHSAQGIQKKKKKNLYLFIWLCSLWFLCLRCKARNEWRKKNNKK